MPKESLKNLLVQTNTILKHNNEIQVLKGESYNIFSVLGMERKENATHSAFISSLLNPKGSHLKNSLYLKLFLKVINNNDFIADKARIQIEKHIGKVNFDNKEGGRIDIYIEDTDGKTLSIENKIDANDQEKQIERYCNHNQSKNTVYYLTLFGDEPCDSSKGLLQSGQDFHCISYNKTILEWLQLCFENSVDDPIIRETIKQYIILIKKITGTLTNKEMEKDIMDLIINNLEASEIINNNYEKAMNIVKEDFRLFLFKKLKQSITDKRFTVILGNNVSNKFSQIWIVPANTLNDEIRYGIESFSGNGHFDGQLFYGLLTNKYKPTELPTKLNNHSNFGNWVQIIKYDSFEGQLIILRYKYLLKLIHKDGNFRERLANYLTNEFLHYFEATSDELINFIEKQNSITTQFT